jgi:hypothetical protein
VRILLLSLLIIVLPVHSSEVIKYHGKEKEVMMRSTGDTLLVLPAPPLSANCQPNDVVTVSQVDAASELYNYGESGAEINKKIEAGQGEIMLARTIKIVPLSMKKDSTCVCSFRLTSDENIQLKLIFDEKITRPTIEITNSANISSESSSEIRNLNAINLFRSYIRTQHDNSSKYLNVKNIELSITDYKEIGEYILTTLYIPAANNIGSIELTKRFGIGELFWGAMLTPASYQNPTADKNPKNILLYLALSKDISKEDIIKRINK